METIRNYLESMFANLPNTPEVQRAKDELLQMMEDKYNELLAGGKTANEAIGVVISEFGNLDELADSLGIENVVKNSTRFSGNLLTLQQAKDYMQAHEKSALRKSLGVMLCIISPVSFIIATAVSEGFHTDARVPVAIGLAVFFILIALAIGLFVYNGVRMEKWRFIRRQPCCIDYSTAEYLHTQREAGRMTYALLKTVGILLCVACFVPVAVMGAIGVQNAAALMMGSAILFFMVGIGVMMMINAAARERAYITLLQLNDAEKVSGNYVPSQKEAVYTNEKVAAVMEVYYPSVLCIYLCWSFLTFDWHITWIIWPVAAIVKNCLDSVWTKKTGQGGV